jgi:hypothetical protein
MQLTVRKRAKTSGREDEIRRERQQKIISAERRAADERELPKLPKKKANIQGLATGTRGEVRQDSQDGRG